MSEDPDYDAIVGELRRLREIGLVGLRELAAEALVRAAERARAGEPGMSDPALVEALVRAAVDRLDVGRLESAARYSFGLVPGTRDWPAQDRRRRAAEIFGVSPERFRKSQEIMIVRQMAEAVIDMAAGPGRTPQRPAEWEIKPSATVTAEGIPVTVHTRSVALLTDIDIVASPHNVYFEPPQVFKSSVSASLRRASLRRGDSGEIVEDVVHRGLSTWMEEHGRRGLSVALGTVVPTSAGAMESRGVRRIYHVAVTVPRPGTDTYDVPPEAISLAVENVFRTARQERDRFDPPLSSLCFPLLGAGRGGLAPGLSAELMWSALRRELMADASWSVHLVTRRSAVSGLITSLLGGSPPLPEQARLPPG